MFMKITMSILYLLNDMCSHLLKDIRYIDMLNFVSPKTAVLNIFPITLQNYNYGHTVKPTAKQSGYCSRIITVNAY